MRLQVNGVVSIEITDPEGICLEAKEKPPITIGMPPFSNPTNPWVNQAMPRPPQKRTSPGLPQKWHGNWESTNTDGRLQARWKAITAITGKENYSI